MAEELGRPFLDRNDFNRDEIDLEQAPLEQVFEHLKTSPAGLSSEDAEVRLTIFGHNKLQQKPENQFLKFLGFSWNPPSWLMGIAAVITVTRQGQTPAWGDFFGILGLLLINSTFSYIEENIASNAAAILKARLAPKAKVLRDGQWQQQDASVLVPGDIISVKLGDVIPADARLLWGDSLIVDESALTRETLPVAKTTGDRVFSGSICMQGEIEAVVIATGVHSFLEKSTNLVDSRKVGHSQKALASVRDFCIYSVAVGMIIKIVIMLVQHQSYRHGINDLLVLLIGGIPIAMPAFLTVSLAAGSYLLSQQGVVTKRITTTEEMAAIDVLCCGKTEILTLNRLTVDRNLVEVFNKNLDKGMVILFAARASRIENQDSADAAIINMLSDPEEARANITEVHFSPFNLVDKRSTITYTDSDGNWYRASRGDAEQILNMCQEKAEIAGRVHAIIYKYAERGSQSFAVAYQGVPEKSIDSPGGPWNFCGMLPVFDPPRHDSNEAIHRAQNLGVSVKMITDDHFAIAKETGKQLGIGTNMYSYSSLLGGEGNESEALPLDELIEKADGFAGVSPENKYEIVKTLQENKHLVGVTGDSANDIPALKKADIGIAVSHATDAAKSSADILLTEPGLSKIITAFEISGAIFQRINNYTIYAVSITIYIVLGFMLLTSIWNYHFPLSNVLFITMLNSATSISLAKDKVKPSARPYWWNLKEIYATGILLGTYLALVTVLFYWVITGTNFLEKHFGVDSISDYPEKVSVAMYLQMSISSQALTFVTRTRGWSFLEKPKISMIIASVVAPLATAQSFSIGIGWRWTGVIWLYNIIFYLPLDIIKFIVRFAFEQRTLSGSGKGN